MAKYRKILVAYDGSASARKALSLASQLAREDKSWIKVLAVMPPYQGDLELVGISNIKETIEGPGRKLLTEAQQVADVEDVHILTNLEQGEPYERIVHVADEENCDLIVLGRRGQGRIERELVGNVTARVIGHTAKNVLVVPEETEVTHWRNILLATDGSPYSEHGLAAAIDIAKERDGRLTAVSVEYTNDEFLALAPETLANQVRQRKAMLEEIRARTEKAGTRLEIAVREGEPHQAITRLAVELGSNLIVMGSHGRKGLTRLLMGSVTERVIGFAPCPVLVVHAA